jgi:hypothetical protein
VRSWLGELGENKKMIRHTAAPLYQQILYDIFIPPVGAVLWWLMSRGLATTVQGGTVSEETKRRQKFEFVVVLIVTYLIMFSITIFAYFSRG